jgi:hypothetical protein
VSVTPFIAQNRWHYAHRSMFWGRSSLVNDDIAECPCYPICSGLGVETAQWCRYRKSDLPPPGTHKFNPRDSWCPPGVQATVLLLGHMLAGQSEDHDAVAPLLERVRRWVESLRARPASSYLRGQVPTSSKGN